jgi:hypothetical protein
MNEDKILISFIFLTAFMPIDRLSEITMVSKILKGIYFNVILWIEAKVDDECFKGLFKILY